MQLSKAGTRLIAALAVVLAACLAFSWPASFSSAQAVGTLAGSPPGTLTITIGGATRNDAIRAMTFAMNATGKYLMVVGRSGSYCQIDLAGAGLDVNVLIAARPSQIVCANATLMAGANSNGPVQVAMDQDAFKRGGAVSITIAGN